MTKKQSTIAEIHQKCRVDGSLFFRQNEWFFVPCYVLGLPNPLKIPLIRITLLAISPLTHFVV